MGNDKENDKKNYCCICKKEILEGVHRWMCDECKKIAARNRNRERYWQKKRSYMTFIAQLTNESAEKKALSNVYITMENGKWVWKSRASKVMSSKGFKTYKECRRDALDAFL